MAHIAYSEILQQAYNELRGIFDNSPTSIYTLSNGQKFYLEWNWSLYTDEVFAQLHFTSKDVVIPLVGELQDKLAKEYEKDKSLSFLIHNLHTPGDTYIKYYNEYFRLVGEARQRLAQIMTSDKKIVYLVVSYENQVQFKICFNENNKIEHCESPIIIHPHTILRNLSSDAFAFDKEICYEELIIPQKLQFLGLDKN